MKHLVAPFLVAVGYSLAALCDSSRLKVRFRPPRTVEVLSNFSSGAQTTCIVLINSQLVANCPCGTVTESEPAGCVTELPASFSGGGRDALSVAVYTYSADSEDLSLIDVFDGDRLQVVSEDGSNEQEFTKVTARPVKDRPRILIYNTVENTPGTQRAVNIFNATGSFTSVEEIVQSAGKMTCSGQKGTCGIYHATPEINGQPSYYCWWRRRNESDHNAVNYHGFNDPGWKRRDSFWETSFISDKDLPPDCNNISANARYFANLWHKTGVDVIVPDTTNLDQDGAEADLLNMRPVEVLAEELVALRSQGVDTPQLAVWTVAGRNTTMYRGMLRAVLNNAKLSDLLLREPTKQKAIYFVHGATAGPPDPEVVAAIESNGGANNVSVIEMWANASPSRAAGGLWTFFQPCQDGNGFTTTVLNDPNYQCNHLKSAGKPGGIGSQMSAAMSWQSHAASLAWASPSKLMGLTFQVMIDDVLREKPDNILLPSFDEWGATPMAFDKTFWNAQYTVGFPPDEQHVMFVDTFGAERSRTWAPSVEAGDFYLRLTQSCLRVVALAAESRASKCTVAGELCCDRTAAQFTRVFSLQRTDNTDYLPTKDSTEVEKLVKSGQYKQICTSSLGGYGSDYFCFSRAEKDFLAHMGPFMVYSSAQVPAESEASLLHRGPRISLYRCRATCCNGSHFVSVTADCDGEGVMESLLGYASVHAHTGMPRLLRRCVRAGTGVHYHTLGAYCLSNDTSTSLAYVF